MTSSQQGKGSFGYSDPFEIILNQILIIFYNFNLYLLDIHFFVAVVSQESKKCFVLIPFVVFING